MNIKLNEGAIMPTRAHEADAGLDLYTPYNVLLKAGHAVVIDTGVCVELPKDTAGVLVSKSGLNVKHGITSTGLIDEQYTGSIRVKLYNHSSEDYTFRGGDKISQLMIVPIVKPKLVLVDSLGETDRGEDGFGSSGR